MKKSQSQEKDGIVIFVNVLGEILIYVSFAAKVTQEPAEKVSSKSRPKDNDRSNYFADLI